MNFTPEQHQAITSTAARLCVDAGAGSGKTRVLVERIVHLVEHRGVALERIAAITFTDKAAAEMKARLRGAFRKRAQAAIDDPARMSYWRDLEHRVDTARISTIHAFCTGLLREYALQIGLDPDFAILGDAESALLLSDTVRATVIGLLEARDEAALLLAAEIGPGKLREVLEGMLTQAPAVRQAAARHDFSSPQALYASWEALVEEERAAALLAFKNSARLRQLGARLEEFAGACTKASDGREVLRLSMIETLRALPKARLKDIPAHLEALTAKVGSTRKQNWADEAQCEALKSVQEGIRDLAAKALSWPAMNPTLDLAAAELACALHAVYGHATTAWEAVKRAANAMDFDGIIQEALRVLRENAEVRARAAAGLQHLLIDEFQDTDRVQLEIAALLCGEPGGPDFFFVGDPKQSIYNFRGAEVEIFVEERGKIGEAIPLRENFRTVPPIIHFINDFFLNSALLEAVGTYAQLGAGRAHDAGEHPRVEWLVVRECDDEGEKRNAEACRREEARLIAARIQALCAPGAPALVHDEADGWRTPRFSDVALLFRSTSSLYLYEEALRGAGVDFVATAGTGFHRRQEILDVCNLLRVVVNPHDGAALAAFLRSPLGRMSDDGLLLLTGKDTLLSAYLRGDNPSTLTVEDSAALAEARALIAELRVLRHLPVPELLQYIYTRTGIEAIALDHHYGLQKASNLRKLLALAQDFSAHTRAPLERFVRYLGDVAENAALREGEAMLQPFGGGAVTLMTVHKSKGLEFPIVFVCDMGQGQQDPRESSLFLHRDLGFALRGSTPNGEGFKPAVAEAITRRSAAKDEAESARLLYVAMTRARDVLVLCGKEKPGKGSWFEAIARTYTLNAIDDGGIVAGEGWHGQLRWTLPQGTRPTKVAAAPDEVEIRTAFAALSAPQAPAPALTTISISELLNRMGTTDDGEDADDTQTDESATPSQGSVALRRGSMVHRLFELWNFAANTPPPIEAALDGAPLGPAERQRLRQELATLAERFQQGPSYARLRAATTMEREIPFALRLGEVVAHGTVDALLNGTTIVDYKTGREDPEKQARYEQQLRLYALALERITGTAPTEAVLLYVDAQTERSVALSPALLAETLAAAERTFTKAAHA